MYIYQWLYIYIWYSNMYIVINIYIYMLPTNWFKHIHYWLVVHLPLWKMMEFVSWDDEIPNWMENKKMFQTTNQIYCTSKLMVPIHMYISIYVSHKIIIKFPAIKHNSSCHCIPIAKYISCVYIYSIYTHHIVLYIYIYIYSNRTA